MEIQELSLETLMKLGAKQKSRGGGRDSKFEDLLKKFKENRGYPLNQISAILWKDEQIDDQRKLKRLRDQIHRARKKGWKIKYTIYILPDNSIVIYFNELKSPT